MAKLTAKQEKFVNEYLVDLNATQAAIRAGYSTKTAKEQGSQLLTKLNIRACIDVAIAEQSKRTGINADIVIRELARIGRLNPGKVINFDTATILKDATDDDLAAVASVRVKTIPGEGHDGVEREVKFHDKTKALELLGRHLGIFNDKLNITGEGVVQIVDDINKANKTD